MADANSTDATATEPFNAQQDQTTIGPELRRIRKEQNRTLQSVADAAGVTKGFLSLLERNKCQVSVPTLLSICTALKIHLKDLFRHPSSQVVDSGAPFEMGGIGIQEFLLTPVDEEYLQVMRTVIEPGGGSGGAYSSDTETIFVLVLRGSILLIVDDERRNLEAGSSTTFRARDIHEWYNTFDGETEVVWAVSPPWNMASHDIRQRSVDNDSPA